ncbi:MAG: hypothetical protein BEN19_06395 [Epulopiscium sp. Nuni2H_MBin003]|nr:MAG: hypothetical protein BEN19_06395 [Epulopiscium sp. Nuni2H_MBin003]
MKILVAYSSKTGNTKKLAGGIYSIIKKDMTEHEVKFANMKNVKNTAEYDVILAGYWVDKGSPNKEATKFLSTITGKRIGIFATLGAYPDSKHGADSLVRGEDLVKDNNEIIGKFICQGAVNPKFLELFRSITETPDASEKGVKAILKGKLADTEFVKNHAMTPERIKMYQIAETHPNNLDIKFAANLFKERI